ncbi:MAG: hypothetical protein R2754_13360 [Microthrixaceae bacterium]
MTNTNQLLTSTVARSLIRRLDLIIRDDVKDALREGGGGSTGQDRRGQLVHEFLSAIPARQLRREMVLAYMDLRMVSNLQDASRVLAATPNSYWIARQLDAMFRSSTWLKGWTCHQTWCTDGLIGLDGRIGDDLEECETYQTIPVNSLRTISQFDGGGDMVILDHLMTGPWNVTALPGARWSVEVADGLPLAEINGPADWGELVRIASVDATDDFNHCAPQLGPAPGSTLNPCRKRRDRMYFETFKEGIPEQRYASRDWNRFLMPNWEVLAEHFSGVHLTWQGFVLAEGTLVDLGHGDITMLTGFGSELTVWLRPFIKAARPAPLDRVIPDLPVRDAVSDVWKTEGRSLLRFAGTE